jgi:hypothetical protein
MKIGEMQQSLYYSHVKLLLKTDYPVANQKYELDRHAKLFEELFETCNPQAAFWDPDYPEYLTPFAFDLITICSKEIIQKDISAQKKELYTKIIDGDSCLKKGYT